MTDQNNLPNNNRNSNNYYDETISSNGSRNGEINVAHVGENEAIADNMLNRNNTTARDHLFQAMFSRIALTYDRTFPPFARRFIEFMLLVTAVSVLFVLVYIHMAFVKAPITCLDDFALSDKMAVSSSADGSVRQHMVIRVEVLSSPPPQYGLHNSYAKEYEDWNRMNQTESPDDDNSASKQSFSRMSMFFSVIRKQCHRNELRSVPEAVAQGDQNRSDSEPANPGHSGRDSSRQPEGLLHRLFNFPINPILEKAEYWREKLSVRAMAPFRQTFNELELFAKSVFTEEKYIMEYSLEYGLLRLTPQTRERLNIPVHFVLLDSSKDQCFGNAISKFLLQEFVGYDQIIIGSLKRLAEKQSGKGYVRNVVSGEHYRFVNSWMSRTSYLAAGFIMIIFTLSVSMLLRYSHHQIFVFIVDLLRMLENNLQFSFPAAPLLTVVLALVGMEAIMSEFFNDTSTAFYTILIIWLADQYEAVCCRTYVSKRHWPKYFYLYHFAFYGYHYRFNGQFSGLALLCSWLFIQHSMFFFFHHYELPRLMHGIAVRAIMDSLIVERGENTSVTPSSIFLNEDDNDRSDGDRFDNDGDAGSSNMQSMAPSGESPGPKDEGGTQHGNPEEPEGTRIQGNSSNIHSEDCTELVERASSLIRKYGASRQSTLSSRHGESPRRFLSSVSRDSLLVPRHKRKSIRPLGTRVSRTGDSCGPRSQSRPLEALVDEAVRSIFAMVTATNLDVSISLVTNRRTRHWPGVEEIIEKIQDKLVVQNPRRRLHLWHDSCRVSKETDSRLKYSRHRHKDRTRWPAPKTQPRFQDLIGSHVNLSRKCVAMVTELSKLAARFVYVGAVHKLAGRTKKPSKAASCLQLAQKSSFLDSEEDSRTFVIPHRPLVLNQILPGSPVDSVLELIDARSESRLLLRPLVTVACSPPMPLFCVLRHPDLPAASLPVPLHQSTEIDLGTGTASASPWTLVGSDHRHPAPALAVANTVSMDRLFPSDRLICFLCSTILSCVLLDTLHLVDVPVTVLDSVEGDPVLNRCSESVTHSSPAIFCQTRPVSPSSLVDGGDDALDTALLSDSSQSMIDHLLAHCQSSLDDSPDPVISFRPSLLAVLDENFLETPQIDLCAQQEELSNRSRPNLVCL